MGRRFKLKDTLQGQLTQHVPGSVQELWIVSCPIILSLFSVNLMVFVDRLILSKCGVQVMNSVVIADLVFNLFQLGAMEIAAVSEIFVGRFNGSKRYHFVGKTIWQAIWFSIASTLFFIPLGLFAGPYLLPSAHLTEGLPFFKWITFFGPMFPLHAALAAFFIGQGRAKLVMMVTLLSNLLNALLDFTLVFGIDGQIPAVGAAGVAIATGVAQTIQVLFLLLIFLQPCYRQTYGTSAWNFDSKLFWQLFQVGCPKAILSMTGLVAWSMLSQIVGRMSQAHITVFSIGDSFYTLFAFSFWGIQRGVATIAANYIGAGRNELVGQCLKSGIKIILIMVMLLSLPLLCFPEILIKQFFHEQYTVINDNLTNHALQTLRWLWVYFMLDAIAWVISGVLTAANDIKYITILNIFSTLMFLIVPNYLCMLYFHNLPATVWIFCSLSAAINAISFYLRYRSQQWGTAWAFHAHNH